MDWLWIWSEVKVSINHAISPIMYLYLWSNFDSVFERYWCSHALLCLVYQHRYCSHSGIRFSHLSCKLDIYLTDVLCCVLDLNQELLLLSKSLCLFCSESSVHEIGASLETDWHSQSPKQIIIHVITLMKMCSNIRPCCSFFTFLWSHAILFLSIHKFSFQMSPNFSWLCNCVSQCFVFSSLGWKRILFCHLQPIPDQFN